MKTLFIAIYEAVNCHRHDFPLHANVGIEKNTEYLINRFIESIGQSSMKKEINWAMDSKLSN